MAAYYWGVSDHIEGIDTVGKKRRHRVAGSGLWWGFLVLGVFVLIARLIDLQVVQGAYYKDVADNQRIRLISVPAPRGLIYDRNGIALVQNVPVFRVLELDDNKRLVLRHMSRNEALDLRSKEDDRDVIEAVARTYLYGPTTAHLLGYIGETTEDELNDDELAIGACPDRWRLGSLVGRTGLEETYDCWLRGNDGTFLIEVDTAGGVVRDIGREEPSAGRDLDLTIDIGLQELLASILGDDPSAAIVSTLDGEILALASAPSFDPNYFGIPSRLENPAETSAALNAMFADEKLPLMNRTIAALYPPGSIFKMVTATAGLEGDFMAADELYEDTGAVQIGEYQFRNWYKTKYGGVEGRINVARALARSTDTYFYHMGGLMGADYLADWARKFGLGETSGLGLQGERAGLVPNPEWKLSAKGERWYLGNTYHMSIGQGDLLVTPLQAHMLVSTVANNGVHCTPRLVRDDQLVNVVCQDLGVGTDTMKAVIDGMVQACAPGGTGSAFFDFPDTVACKTGTAEYGPVNEKGFRETHAWFTVFGPLDDPEVEPVLITVFVESGGEGSEAAAPLAREIMNVWMAREGKPVEVLERNVQDENDHDSEDNGGDEEGAVVN